MRRSVHRKVLRRRGRKWKRAYKQRHIICATYSRGEVRVCRRIQRNSCVHTQYAIRPCSKALTPRVIIGQSGRPLVIRQWTTNMPSSGSDLFFNQLSGVITDNCSHLLGQTIDGPLVQHTLQTAVNAALARLPQSYQFTVKNVSVGYNGNVTYTVLPTIITSNTTITTSNTTGWSSGNATTLDFRWPFAPYYRWLFNDGLVHWCGLGWDHQVTKCCDGRPHGTVSLTSVADTSTCLACLDWERLNKP